MKSLNVFVVAMLCAGLILTACRKDNHCPDGKGSIETRTLSIPSFSGINMEIAADVILTQGPNQEVIAIGHSNVIDKIDNDVSGGIWDIDFGRDCFDDYELTLHITVPNLDQVSLSGTGDITVNDFSNQDDLFLSISGSGTMDVGAFTGCEDLSIHISGSGSIRGNSEFPDLKDLDIKISGSGDYEGFPISTDNCDIHLTGSGSCEVFVRDVLDVSISGSGEVFYKGTPSVSANVNGSGKVVNAN